MFQDVLASLDQFRHVSRRQQLDPSPFVSELLIHMEAATLFAPLTTKYYDTCLECDFVSNLHVVI